MAVSSNEYWSVIGSDGVEVALNQYAWSVQNYGGSSRGLPPLRGEDQVYANRVGQAFRPKMPGARTVVLEMFVNGIDPTTDGVSDDPDLQFNKNLSALQTLFWTPSSQITLKRRWRTAAGIQVASAKAQIAGLMEPEMTGRTRATLSVELLLSDPYFYSDPTTVTIPVSGSEVWIDYPGTVPVTGYGCYLRATGAIGWPTGRMGDPGIIENFSGFMVQAEYFVNGVPRPDLYPTQYLTYAETDTTVLKDRGIPAGSSVEVSLFTSTALSSNHLLGHSFIGVADDAYVSEVTRFVPNWGWFPVEPDSNTAPGTYSFSDPVTGVTSYGLRYYTRPVPSQPSPNKNTIGAEVYLSAAAGLISEAPTAPWVDWDAMADGTPVRLINVGSDYYDLRPNTTYYLAGVDPVAQKFGLARNTSGIPEPWAIGGNQRLGIEMLTVPEPFPVIGYVDSSGGASPLLLEIPAGGRLRLTLRDPLTGNAFNSYQCDGNALVQLIYRVPWV